MSGVRRSRRPRGDRAQKPAPAASLVEEVLSRYGVATQVREHRIVTRWHDVVGERVASRAWPDGLHQGVLFVRVVSSSWMHELSFLRDAIRERVCEVAGANLVREVRFHVGARRPDDIAADDVVAALARRRPRRPAGRPRPTPSRAELAHIDAELARVEDPALRAALRELRYKLGV